jgi:hypothetical protein
MTAIVDVPLFVWVELLTHKRAARNASSSRAQSPKRHREMGFYVPDYFYFQGDGMKVGDALSDEHNAVLRTMWEEFHHALYDTIEEFQSLLEGYLQADGIHIPLANGIINRLLPTTKMMRGIMTMTEDGWKALLALRCHPDADSAMQQVATQIQDILTTCIWKASDYHLPFSTPNATTEEAFRDQWKGCAGQIARVSYGKPGPGQRSSDDLATDLLNATPIHFSPFEHSASWTHHPLPSTLCSKPEDCVLSPDGVVCGWENVRALIEEGYDDLLGEENL